METPSFKEKLQAIYPKLTSSQKKVARYLFDNPNVLGVMSAQELAAQCGVSESTVIRFAQTLGYPGYLDMKQEIQRDLKNAYSSSQKLSATLRQFADQDTFFSELIQDHRQALDQLESTITLELLKQAAELIVSTGHSVRIWRRECPRAGLGVSPFGCAAWVSTWWISVIRGATSLRRLCT